jgi:unsaturated chondroitin disaccharide hydrolase
MDKEIQYFAERVSEKIRQKMKATALRNPDILPYTSVDGRFKDYKGDICKWTNGFWPGLLWLMYMDTNDSVYKEIAEQAERTLDCAFCQFDGLHHDVGFMWHISSGLDYRLTGNEKSRVRTLLAANLLMGRYNVAGDYIRAWNEKEEGDTTGWAIIDCMMNLAILYWASRETGDDRYTYVAMRHADKTLKNHLRADGSCRHIVEYNPQTGEFVKELGGQGYGAGSCWSRGQGWGLYGFVISYEHTKEHRYLDAAKRIAHYVISCISRTEWLPLCDFRSPAQPVIYDSTAGAIIASGLIELAENVPETERDIYVTAAFKILKAMEEKFCCWDLDKDSILQMGTLKYHGEQERHIPIIYGDYFFVEAIHKLTGSSFKIW